MPYDCSMVPLMQARTPFEAQTVGSLLQAAGIPFYIEGAQLRDEFGASQALLGLNGTKVLVAVADLRKATKLLKEAREAGKDFDKED